MTSTPATREPSRPEFSSVPITMATQTEWDLWGGPNADISLSISPSPPRPQCNCGPIIKQLKEWKCEHVKRCETNENQSRAKLNLVRQKLIESEEDCTKMKATIASLSTQLANNTAANAELGVQRDEGRGFPSGDMVRRANGSGQNNVKETNNPKKATLSSNQRNSGPTIYAVSCGTGPDTMSADLRSLRQVSIFQSPIVRQNSGNKSEGGAPKVSATGQMPGASNQSKQGVRPSTPQPINNGGASSSPATQGQRNQPQRTQPTPKGDSSRAKSAATSKQNSTVPFSAGNPFKPPVLTGNASTSAAFTPQRKERECASTSWADDPISDAEIVAMVDAADTGISTRPRGANSVGTPSTRMSILRDAINDTMQKGYKPRQDCATNTKRRASPAPGEKRGGESMCDGELNESPTSYAYKAADGDWLDPKRRRQRGSSGDRVPVLFGVRQETQRDIFVRYLSYSGCRKPEDLECIVKFHCRRRNVEPIYVKAFTRKNDMQQANCKISVRESDAPTVLRSGFWPEYVKARYWLTNFQYAQLQNGERGSEEEKYRD